MARTLSLNALAAMYAAETGQAMITLVSIDHPSLTLPPRLCSDSKPVISKGVTYTPYPMLITLPDDRSDQMQRASITIDAIDGSVIAGLRSLNLALGRATIAFTLVLASTPDVIEAAFPPMVMTVASYDAFTITATLSEGDLGEPFPGDLRTPATNPGVFGITA